MTAITIDKDKAIELLEKQVADKGEDYVYPYATCLYFAEEKTLDAEYEPVEVECGTPLCIVGNVYADLGLTAEDLYFHDYDSVTVSQDGQVGENLPNPDKVVLTEEAIQVLQTAQIHQDAREPWGKALEAAKEAVS